MPEIEVTLQGLFLIEEEFQNDEDDEEDIVGGLRDSALSNVSDGEAGAKKAEATFSRENRVAAFHDATYVSKFAHHCAPTSQMRLLNVEKIKFSGPDPPLEPEKPAETEVVEEVKAPPPKGK